MTSDQAPRRRLCRGGYILCALVGALLTCVLAWGGGTFVKHAAVGCLAGLLLLPSVSDRRLSVVQALLGLYLIGLILGDLGSTSWSVNVGSLRAVVSPLVLPVGVWLLGAALNWAAGDAEPPDGGLMTSWAVAVTALAGLTAALGALLHSIHGGGWGQSYRAVIAALAMLLPVVLLWPLLRMTTWRRVLAVLLFAYYGASCFVSN